ncbi:MAG TPA: MFS transporter, partial [Vicinamibacteria bacterium]|nr:MFS transporter [Vicinamibacteria bacterium]
DFLKFSGTEIAWIFAAWSIASVTTMLFSTQIADRYVSSERFLAVSHVIGGLAMLGLTFQETFWPFFLLMLVHSLAFVPTLSLTNSIAFHHLKDAQNEFGRLRLWGTIGWIAASWPFFFLLADKEGRVLEAALTSIFVVAGLSSLVLAAWSLLLPATPPARNAAEKSAPLEAIKLLGNAPVLVLFLVTFLDAMVHQCYFFWTGPFLSSIGIADNKIMAAMSIGQIAEIATMAGLGYFLKRLGWRWTMIFGILGHALRFFVYSIGQPVWLVVGSNVVHGFCYAFFFASVYIFVDEYFPKDARASAQGLFNFLILGFGPFVGNLLWGWLGDAYTTAGVVDFSRLFLVPSGLGLAAAVVLFLAFHPEKRPAPAVEARAA